MDQKTFEHLCGLSKLNYADEERERTIAEMSDIIDLMDTIKDFDISYDDTKDHNEIAYAALRADAPAPSFPTERLQQNTAPRDNCYVVPKMME
ncbi:MAG: aspartyl/glutamyl-tRNA amidotransferase subunit C [Bacteroides sp.]|nr:aspartyl/glutamyl-tRNA amidotransferase subunit C [Roseburia sp.]MCM1463352.1 aspartyl/glutamyl-tRNA amidotransferase subunit C [Bacteroides sp.]